MLQQGFNGFLRIVTECFTLMTWQLCNPPWLKIHLIFWNSSEENWKEADSDRITLHQGSYSHTWYLLLVTHSSLHMPTSDNARYAAREQQCSSMAFPKGLVIHMGTAYFQGLFPSYTVQCSILFALFIQPWALIPYWQRIRMIFGQPNSLRYNQGPNDLPLLEQCWRRAKP